LQSSLAVTEIFQQSDRRHLLGFSTLVIGLFLKKGNFWEFSHKKEEGEPPFGKNSQVIPLAKFPQVLLKISFNSSPPRKIVSSKLAIAVLSTLLSLLENMF